MKDPDDNAPPTIATGAAAASFPSAPSPSSEVLLQASNFVVTDHLRLHSSVTVEIMKYYETYYMCIKCVTSWNKTHSGTHFSITHVSPYHAFK